MTLTTTTKEKVCVDTRNLEKLERFNFNFKSRNFTLKLILQKMAASDAVNIFSIGIERKLVRKSKFEKFGRIIL